MPTNGKVLGFASDFYSLDPRVRRGDCGHGLRAVLRRPRPGEHQAGRHDPGRQPHRRVRARLPVLLRPRRHDHRRPRRPRRQGADGDRQLDRRARPTRASRRATATTSARCGPGVLLTACQPFTVISINRRGRRLAGHPKVLYTGEAAKFVHSARWPRDGTDKFVLIGGEENFPAAASTTTASSRPTAPGGPSGSPKFEGPLDQVPPAATATTPTASRPPARSAARSTGSRSTRRSTTAASSRSPSTRTACASCRSRATARSPSRATSSRSAAPRHRPSGPARTTSSTRSTTSAGSTSSGTRATPTCPTPRARSSPSAARSAGPTA